MGAWWRNVVVAVKTVAQGMWITLWYFLQTYKRKAFTQHFEYPELPVPVKPRYRGFHRFDLTTCIGCDKCARACPVDCIYIDKIKNPVGKGFRVTGFKIDYSKCMFCALCVDPCPVDAIYAEEDVPETQILFVDINKVYFKDKALARSQVADIKPPVAT